MVLTAVLVAALTIAGGELQPGDHTRSVPLDQATRTYRIHVPPSYTGEEPFPVVLAFHGGAANAESMVRFSGLSSKADEAGFIAVYPNGTGRYARILAWNAGNCCGTAARNRVDDVAFVRALLDDLATAARVDPKRVYATGMSNGAMITYRLASELADRIAAIAPVAGPMGTATCRPSRPVPVMHFHGTDDAYAPFAGGTGKRSITQTNFYSVEHSIGAWVEANGCPKQPITTQEPDRADDGTTVTRKTHGPGRQGSEVILYVIHGGGHTWPGRRPPFRFMGTFTKDISANDLMWEFFKRHPMP